MRRFGWKILVVAVSVAGLGFALGSAAVPDIQRDREIASLCWEPQVVVVAGTDSPRPRCVPIRAEIQRLEWQVPLVGSLIGGVIGAGGAWLWYRRRRPSEGDVVSGNDARADLQV